MFYPPLQTYTGITPLTHTYKHIHTHTLWILLYTVINLLVGRRFGHVGVPLGAEIVAGRLPVLGVAPRHLQQGLLVLFVTGRYRRGGSGHGRRGGGSVGQQRRGSPVDRAGRPPGSDVPPLSGPRTPVPTTHDYPHCTVLARARRGRPTFSKHDLAYVFPIPLVVHERKSRWEK